MQNITSNLIFTNEQVASNYGLTTGLTIAKHFLRNADELIENIHYFYDYEQTKGGRQRVIKWTLEGVYKLFDKIKKLKERSKMAEEKESKGSYNLQIKIPNELKDKLEKKAEKAGVSLNQYIMYLFIDDIKNERI
ncbi:toxin-antitoxin system HicB family antitoxin [Campylobacter jejuni]|uniref:toxin-antitoxin system HicB family antitoxin n=1 Tax=Campylobacter jejuni TaxID=197 RepID=UPI000A5FCB6C|nr:toxin-antitoxin system HicB family antitoxin [Campylobacter jejuni]